MRNPLVLVATGESLRRGPCFRPSRYGVAIVVEGPGRSAKPARLETTLEVPVAAVSALAASRNSPAMRVTVALRTGELKTK